MSTVRCSYDPAQNLRNCTIVTQLHNPIDDSEKYIASNIQAVIDEHIDQIKSYAWIIHDKDLILEDDMYYYENMLSKISNDSKLKAYYESMSIGSPKPTHVHVVINWKNGKKREEIAKWFECNNTSIRSGVLNKPGSRFNINVILYLLHRNDERKYQYDESEIFCDLQTRIELTRYLKEYEILESLNKSKDIDEILEEMKHGKTASEVYNDPDIAFQIFMKNEKLIRSAETTVRLYDPTVPDYLLNIYIQGGSGTGKTSIAKLLARSLYPNQEYPYFSIGAKGVALQNYAGQKVILWDDITQHKMLSVAPTGDIQDLLDPYQQEKTAQNIKNSYVILNNEVNIFTSTIPYDDFYKGLINNDTPIEQIYRRIPIVLIIDYTEIYLLINKGEWDGKPSEWTQFEKIKIAKVNTSNIMQSVPYERLLEPEILGSVINIIIQIIKNFVERKRSKKLGGEEEIYNSVEHIKLYAPNEKYMSKKTFEEIEKKHERQLDELGRNAAILEEYENYEASKYMLPEHPWNYISGKRS